jgi:hypothetical protein
LRVQSITAVQRMHKMQYVMKRSGQLNLGRQLEQEINATTLVLRVDRSYKHSTAALKPNK